MKIDKLRILIGGDKCNANCPYCVTKMVKKHVSEPSTNSRRVNTACNYASKSGALTVMLGGIGEPTMYPECVDEMLEKIAPYNFPIIELETNGYLMSKDSYENHLKKWADKGLTTIQVSILSYDDHINSELMHLPLFSREKLLKKLQSNGYSTRLSCVLYKGGVDSAETLEKLMLYSKPAKQLLLRPVTKPYNPSGSVFSWVKEHELKKEDELAVINYLGSSGTKLHDFNNGRIMYDINSQSVIFAKPIKFQDEVKQLILFPNGTIRYELNYAGAILL